jgi:phenylpropionate dioxygenase-like ring-hydroxylating dioxygenase large terminal subunit
LGSYSQLLHSNWKLYMENVKDTYHASLLHTFFTTFRLNRLSQKGGVIVSDCGGHHVSYALAETPLPHTPRAPSPLVGEGGGGGSVLGETRPAIATPTPSPSPQGGGEHTRRVDEYAGMRAAQEGFGLEAPVLLESVDEFGDGVGLQILSVFPSFVLQQTRNSLAVRRLVPQGLERTELVWTCFGFADDDDAMTERRLRQANLIGPAGYISMEDGAAPAFVQRATAGAPELVSVVEMGGASVASDDNRVTEAAVRGFWKAYRGHMGL